MKVGDLESNHAFRAFLYQHTSDVITARGDEMKELALAMLIFLLAPFLCLAQAAKKIPVAVSHSDDQVGQAFALKEAIRGSATKAH